ncbi:ComF family protein [uncultured Sphingomonas sp.]|uniref:ComF family protein n=1 Tax=uncultured Sphingomonas sp. TaxID=158754 RepID=UPI0035CBB45C
MAVLIRSLNALGRLALPPRCAGCGTIVGEDHRFCGACWSGMRFLGPPWCAGCRVPFEYDRGEDARCAACLADPPRHAGVFAAVAYDELSRRLALNLKYGRRVGLGETMARYMARIIPGGVDLLVPVPLHRWRLWSRGFNQAVVIGAAVSRATEVPLDREALVRTRATPSLKGQGRTARARAVRGAFAVPDRERIAGRRIALIDDIYTTGATAQAATAALLRAGAASAAVLCWARVLGDDD